jgi:hypothetical protein
MNPSERSEVLQEADHDQKCCGNPRVETGQQGSHSYEPIPPRDPSGPPAPDGRATETFADGAGI